MKSKPYIIAALAAMVLALPLFASGQNVMQERIDGLRLSIGNNSNGSEKNVYGYVDEARLSDGSLSAERIAADYKTVTQFGFFVYGAVRHWCSGSVYYIR